MDHRTEQKNSLSTHPMPNSNTIRLQMTITVEYNVNRTLFEDSAMEAICRTQEELPLTPFNDGDDSLTDVMNNNGYTVKVIAVK